jgi:hypothetical protein
MPTNPELRNKLLKHLGCSPPALSQRVSVIKRKYGPMTTEDAVYLIAHKQEIDLSKYLDKNTVDKIRTLIPQEGRTRELRLNKKKIGERKVVINIDANIPQVDAMLSTAIAQDVKKMAQVYPLQYILENSLRVVIKKVLEKKYSKNWWGNKVKTEINNRVEDRKIKEDKQPWHGKRGQHEIFYSDFSDLKSIISKNWDDFKTIFPSQQWIIQRLDDLEHPRNIIAHNNPLSEDDKKRIGLYLSDWLKLLGQKRNLI